MKTTYFYLQSQTDEPAFKDTLVELEKDKQRHEDLLEDVLEKLLENR